MGWGGGGEEKDTLVGEQGGVRIRVRYGRVRVEARARVRESKVRHEGEDKGWRPPWNSFPTNPKRA